jgi:cell fate (sporulation/competence/biofilm development) regulator YmcA (YheA/YmcA/DUF963 family)
MYYIGGIIICLLVLDIFNGYKLSTAVSGKSSEELSKGFSDIIGLLQKTSTTSVEAKELKNNISAKLKQATEYLDTLEKILANIKKLSEAKVIIDKVVKFYDESSLIKVFGNNNDLTKAVEELRNVSKEIDELIALEASVEETVNKLKTVGQSMQELVDTDTTNKQG